MNNDVKVIGGLIGATVLVIAAILIFGSHTKQLNTNPIKVSDAQLIQPYSPRRGPDTAPVRIVEFADLQCPACARLAPMIDQAVTDYGDKIQIVYRYFPLTQIHQNAELAAQAGAAANEQGKFWQFADTMFNHQANWGTASSSQARTLMEGYAASLGLNTARFSQDIDNQQLVDHIRQDVGDGNALQIDATPTIYINGQQTNVPLAYSDLKSDIDQTLASASPSPSH